MAEEKSKIIKSPKAKRMFDILISFLILIISAPLFLVITIVITIENIFESKKPSPIFYKETRISQGQKFQLIKFNIFKNKIIKEKKNKCEFIHTKDLEKADGCLKKSGQILKKIYLDELPQLINILKGEISLVGPRPVNLEVYQKLLARGVSTKTIIKAGLTGSFQCQKGMTTRTDIELDQEYIDYCKNNSAFGIVFNDIKILLKTLKVIFKAKGI